MVCLSAWVSISVQSGVCPKCVDGANTSLGDIGIAIVREMEGANGLAGWGAITETFDFERGNLYVVCKNVWTKS